MALVVDNIQIKECSTPDEWNALSSIQQAELFAKNAVKQVGKCKAIRGKKDDLEKWKQMFLSAHDPKALNV